MKIQVKEIEKLNKYTNDISLLREFIESSEDIRNRVFAYYEMLDESSYPNKADDIDTFILRYMIRCNDYQKSEEKNIFKIYNEIISALFSKTHDVKKIIDISDLFRYDVDMYAAVGELSRKVYLTIIENMPYNLADQESIICSYIVKNMAELIKENDKVNSSILVNLDDYYDDLITYLKSVTIIDGENAESEAEAIGELIGMSIEYGISYSLGSYDISNVMRSICLNPEVAKKTKPLDYYEVVDTILYNISEMKPDFKLFTPYSQYPYSTQQELAKQFPSFGAIDINQSPLLRVYNADFKTSTSENNAKTIISNIDNYFNVYEHILSNAPAHMQEEYTFMITEALITALQENKENNISKNSCEELASLSPEEVVPFYAKLLEAPCDILIDINKAIINDRDFNAAKRLSKYGTLQTTATLLKSCDSIDEYLSIISAVNIKPDTYIYDGEKEIIDMKSLSLVKNNEEK